MQTQAHQSVDAKWEEHLHLVPPIAGNIFSKLPRGSVVGYDDLIQEGSLGLRDAVMKFNPRRGVEFSTYAKQRIWGAMMDGLRSMCFVPRRVRDSGEEIRRTFSLNADHSTAASERTGTDEVSLVEMLEDTNTPTPEGNLVQRDTFNRMFEGLNKDQHTLLWLYFVEGLTLKESGISIGFSQSNASLLLKSALRILRSHPDAARILG